MSAIRPYIQSAMNHLPQISLRNCRYGAGFTLLIFALGGLITSMIVSAHPLTGAFSALNFLRHLPDWVGILSIIGCWAMMSALYIHAKMHSDHKSFSTPKDMNVAPSITNQSTALTKQFSIRKNDNDTYTLSFDDGISPNAQGRYEFQRHEGKPWTIPQTFKQEATRIRIEKRLKNLGFTFKNN